MSDSKMLMNSIAPYPNIAVGDPSLCFHFYLFIPLKTMPYAWRCGVNEKIKIKQA
jgi:hypothetical protein